MILLIDLDDVVCDLMGKSVYFYNNRYGTNIKKEDLTQWDLPDRERWMDMWRIPGFFASLRMMPGAEEGLYKLGKMNHEIRLVSAYPTWESCHGKVQWVHTHLRVPGLIPSMDALYLVRNKSGVRGDIMIDDKVGNLDSFPGEKITFAQPWNKESPYYRATNWSMVVGRVAYLTKQRGCWHLGGCV